MDLEGPLKNQFVAGKIRGNLQYDDLRSNTAHLLDSNELRYWMLLLVRLLSQLLLEMELIKHIKTIIFD